MAQEDKENLEQTPEINEVAPENATLDVEAETTTAQESAPEEEASAFQSASESVQSAAEDRPVTVQAVKFASFDDSAQVQGEINRNLDILMDIKLQLTVELGRTELPIKKVLELTRGSIIELEKVAGEPVELYANGKLVAHGEVVVIEDNFGLRITSITEAEEIIKSAN